MTKSAKSMLDFMNSDQETAAPLLAKESPREKKGEATANLQKILDMINADVTKSK